MNKNKIEKEIKASLSKSKESVWERVNENLFTEPQKEAELVAVSGGNVGIRTNKKLLFVGLFLAVLIAFTSIFYLLFLRKDLSGYIYIDINPSIQISVDKKGKVEEVFALNDDAFVLLSDVNESEFSGKTPEDVAVKIWELALQTGYISPLKDNNAILISGAFGNDEFDKEMNEKLKDSVSSKIKEKGVYCAVLTELQSDALRQKAQEHGITVSKCQLILDAINLGAEILDTEYKDITIAQINQKIEDIAKGKLDALSDAQKNGFLNKKNNLIEKANPVNNGHVKPEDFDDHFDNWREEKDFEFASDWMGKKDQWENDFRFDD